MKIAVSWASRSQLKLDVYVVIMARRATALKADFVIGQSKARGQGWFDKYLCDARIFG